MKEKRQLIRNSTAEFLIFTGQVGSQSIETRYGDETIWLTQKLMAALFEVDVRTISEHLKNIFQSDELQEDSVIRKFRNTAADGKRYLTQFYNLDAIISVGYRVNSVRATHVLREFAIKGYVLDKKRMENGTFLGEDYYERLLEEVLKIPMTMEDWAKRLDLFLEFDERSTLQHKGKVAAEIAKAHAESEFEKYRIVQDRLFESDFDKILKQIDLNISENQRESAKSADKDEAES